MKTWEMADYLREAAVKYEDYTLSEIADRLDVMDDNARTDAYLRD